MSVYPRLTPNQVKYIQTEIEEQTWNNTLLRNFFEVNGLIKNIPEGMLTYETTIWEKLAPGQIGADIYNLPDSVPGFKVQLGKLMTLGTKVVLKMGDVDKWRNNPLGIGGGDMMAQVINQQMRPLYQQVDQFLARGDAFKNPVLGDLMHAAGVFLGLFNGGTTFGAGLGGDDGMVSAGDYLGSVPTAKKALKNAGFEKKKYMIMSDVDTEEDAQKGAHIYVSSIPVTEYRLMLERPDIAGWIASPNFIDQAGTDYKILFTTPFTSEGRPAYRLIQGYNFKVIPLNGGYVNSSLQYETAVIWSGFLEFLFGASCQVSGTLNFAG